MKAVGEVCGKVCSEWWGEGFGYRLCMKGLE